MSELRDVSRVSIPTQAGGVSHLCSGENRLPHGSRVGLGKNIKINRRHQKARSLLLHLNVLEKGSVAGRYKPCQINALPPSYCDRSLSRRSGPRGARAPQIASQAQNSSCNLLCRFGPVGRGPENRLWPEMDCWVPSAAIRFVER
jgi:hypothetical protein